LNQPHKTEISVELKQGLKNMLIYAAQSFNCNERLYIFSGLADWFNLESMKINNHSRGKKNNNKRIGPN